MMSEEVEQEMYALRSFMFDHIYTNSIAKKEEDKAVHMVEQLYTYYVQNPGQLPAHYQRNLSEGEEELEQTVCDYIAGMTDTYAVRKFTEIFVPDAWVLS